MNAEIFLKHYERICAAPDAIPRLRRFVLDLAINGKLVPQVPSEEHDSSVLKAFKYGSTSSSRTNWLAGKLGAILDFHYGKGLKAADRLDRGPVPVYGSNGVVGYTDSPLATEPAIIIGRKGSAGALNLCDGPSWTTDVAYYVVPPSFLDLRFLLISLATLNLNTLGKGVKPGLSRSDAYELELVFPPLAEQRRIVAKVDELVALCDQLEAKRAEREEKRSKFTAATLQRFNQPDPNAVKFRAHATFALNNLKPLTTHPDQIKQIRQTILNLAVRGRILGNVVGQFELLGKYRSLQNGYAFKSEWFTKGGVRLLRNANIAHGTTRWDDSVYLPTERVKEFNRFSLNEGDIVLTLDRPFIVTGTKVARISKADLPCLLLQRVGRFVEIREGLSDDYLFMWINSPHFNEQIDPGRSNGVPHISSKQVEAAEIYIPSTVEQSRIVAKVRNLMALCDQLEASLSNGVATASRVLEATLHEALNPFGALMEAAE